MSIFYEIEFAKYILPYPLSARQVTTARSGRTAAEMDSRSGRPAQNDDIITEFMTDDEWS